MIKSDTPHAPVRAQFLRFAMVGGAGFFVDEGVLALMRNLFGFGPFSGRAVSILCAMSFTWWGNRTITFHTHAARGLSAMAKEWLRYVMANSLGASLNYGSYALLVHFAPVPFDNPYLATAIGVGIGMVSNFTLSRFVVFRADRPDR